MAGQTPCDSAAVSRGTEPLSSGARLPWAPGTGASDPTHTRGRPGVLWGRHPTRGPSPRPECDPAPRSPLLPGALTFGLPCSSLHCPGLSGILPGLFSWKPPPRVSDGLLAARHPAAGIRSPGLPSARLWGGWFDQNPSRRCFLSVIATHRPHRPLPVNSLLLAVLSAPSLPPLQDPPGVRASGIISSLVGVMGEHTCRAHSRCSINAGIPLHTPPRPASGLPSASCHSPVDGFWGSGRSDCSAVGA